MAAAADMRSGYHDLIYYAKKYRQLPQLKCPSSGDLGLEPYLTFSQMQNPYFTVG
jgi:hypothetical protein